MAQVVPSCIKEVKDTFIFRPRVNNEHSTFRGQFGITTANLGLLPSIFNMFQHVGNFFKSFASSHKETLLLPANFRVDEIAKRLAEDSRVPILCCQEVFEYETGSTIASKLTQAGYDVHFGGEKLVSVVGSGILFATRYEHLELPRFYYFTNLTQEDAYSSKGIFRACLQVPIEGRGSYQVIVFNIHLQAQLSEGAVRKQQLQAVLSLVEEEQKKNENALIFVSGDLNMSDIEYDGGSNQQEYTNNKINFFDHFHDLLDLSFDKNGRKQGMGTPQFNDVCVLPESKPQFVEFPSTFYSNLSFCGEHSIQPGCYYDRILLYKGSNQSHEWLGAIVEDTTSWSINVRRIMEDDQRKIYLSDHLPLTAYFHL